MKNSQPIIGITMGAPFSDESSAYAQRKPG